MQCTNSFNFYEKCLFLSCHSFQYIFLEQNRELKQISLVDENELGKLNSLNRVLTLQYDYEVVKHELCERQLTHLQDNINQSNYPI